MNQNYSEVLIVQNYSENKRTWRLQIIAWLVLLTCLLAPLQKPTINIAVNNRVELIAININDFRSKSCFKAFLEFDRRKIRKDPQGTWSDRRLIAAKDKQNGGYATVATNSNVVSLPLVRHPRLKCKTVVSCSQAIGCLWTPLMNE